MVRGAAVADPGARRPGTGSVRGQPAHAGWSGAGGLHRVARAGVPALARAQPALRPSAGRGATSCRRAGQRERGVDADPRRGTPHPRLGAPESARSAAERLPRGRGVRDRGRRRRSGLCLQRAPGAALWSARGVAGKAAARCPNRGAAGGAHAGRGWSALPPGRHRRRGATAGRGSGDQGALGSDSRGDPLGSGAR